MNISGIFELVHAHRPQKFKDSKVRETLERDLAT